MSGPGINDTETEDKLRALAKAIADGSIATVEEPTLRSWSHALCIGLAERRKIALHIVQGFVVSNEQVARRIEKLHEDNTRMQTLVIALAVIAAVGTVIQVLLGLIGLCRGS